MLHAYLIIAHHQFGLLKKLLQMIDYENNDIYLHIDKKAKSFCFDDIKGCIKNATLHMVKRISVSWGTYSQIQCELNLLEAATKTYHDYYHLLSGVDLPIKSHQQIEDFFATHLGQEFVSFDTKACLDREFEDRVRYYWGRGIGSGWIRNASSCFTGMMVTIQKGLGVNRLKGTRLKMMKGSNWFDITHELACFTVKFMQDPKNRKVFKFSSCADELLLQTIIYNSPFNARRSNTRTRYIDWSRHGRSPETLTMAYWERFCKSDRLFARKFDEQTDSEIIQKVYDTFREPV